MKSLKSLVLKDKKVFIRLDLNVPLDKRGKITDTFRIQKALPTLKFILKQKPSQIILATHLDPWKDNPAIKKDPKLSTKKLIPFLEKSLKRKITFHKDLTRPAPKKPLVLLENLRFHKGEKSNSKTFAKQISNNSDTYINEAFSVSHRKHSSVSALPFLVNQKAPGFLLEKEIQNLSPVLKSPKKPLISIVGGTKIESKIKVIDSLAKNSSKILIGGRMALAFHNAQYIDKKEKSLAKKLLKKYPRKLILPKDYLLSNKKPCLPKDLPKEIPAYDLGPKTIKHWLSLLKPAKTIVWNGPLGKFEEKPFDKATNAIARALASSKAITIIGGGDSASAIRKLKLQNKINHISTGGGAALSFLEGKTLPGIKALN